MNQFAEEVLAGMQNRWRRQKTIRELSVLSDHTLRDIGLDRGEIRSVAEELPSRRDGSRVRFTRTTPPVVVPIESPKPSADYIARRKAA